MPTIKELTEDSEHRILELLEDGKKTDEQLQEIFNLNKTEVSEMMTQLIPRVDYKTEFTKHGQVTEWFLVMPIDDKIIKFLNVDGKTTEEVAKKFKMSYADALITMQRLSEENRIFQIPVDICKQGKWFQYISQM